jgi:hypothetical protein
MKIHSKKTFQFVNPGDETDTFKVQNEAIVTAPDWIANTLLFELATKSDANGNADIFVIESKEQQIKAENGDLSQAEANKNTDKDTGSSTRNTKDK